jgi:hypothetical protein
MQLHAVAVDIPEFVVERIHRTGFGKGRCATQLDARDHLDNGIVRDTSEYGDLCSRRACLVPRFLRGPIVRFSERHEQDGTISNVEHRRFRRVREQRGHGRGCTNSTKLDGRVVRAAVGVHNPAAVGPPVHELAVTVVVGFDDHRVADHTQFRVRVDLREHANAAPSSALLAE